MHYLNSSAISAVNYNATTRTLTIWFTHGGHSYDYFGVPNAVYQGLLNASSKGAYFNAFIRDQYAA